jgi:hypothetical protein
MGQHTFQKCNVSQWPDGSCHRPYYLYSLVTERREVPTPCTEVEKDAERTRETDFVHKLDLADSANIYSS